MKKNKGINPAIEETATPKPYVASIGVYGTKKLNEVILKEELGPEFEEWLKKGLSGDEKSLALEKKLVQKIQKKYQFPFAEFSVGKSGGKYRGGVDNWASCFTKQCIGDFSTSSPQFIHRIIHNRTECRGECRRPSAMFGS